MLTPTRSLDGPSDVALVCAAWTPEQKLLMLPLATCNTDNLADPTKPSMAGVPTDGGTATAQLFTLIPNTTRGELAVATTRSLPCNVNDANGNLIVCPNQDTCDTSVNKCHNTLGTFTYSVASIVDLDPRTPEYGFVPIGKLPKRIRATDDGCRAVSANADGCDLAVIDVAHLLAVKAGDQPEPMFISSLSRSVVARTAKGPIRSRPTWVEISARPPATQPATVATCDMNAQAGYFAWVAYPGCQLVAEVDLTTGDVRQALEVTRDGARVVDPASVSCPAECSGEPVDGGADGGATSPLDFGAPADASAPSDASASVDGGAPGDGGAPPAVDGGVGAGGDASYLPTTQAFPQSFAIDYAGKQLFVGDAAGARITVAPFGDSGALAAPTQIALAGDPVGVERVRLSPPVGDDGVVYLYAIARDRSVRVIDVGLGHECETNPDPRYVAATVPYVGASGNVVQQPADVERALRCLPVDGTVPRSALASGPGISIPGGALPRDVAFVHLRTPPDAVGTAQAQAAGPSLLVGDFAWIFDSDGRADAVNLYDKCPQPNDPTNPAAPSMVRFCDPAAFAPSIQAAAGYVGHPLPAAIDLMPNRLRSANARFANVAATDPGGQPRLSDLPAVKVDTTVLDPKDPSHTDVCNVPNGAGAANLPDGGVTDGGTTAPKGACAPEPSTVLEGNFVSFHDPTSVRNETWTFAWEGALPLARSGLAVAATSRATGTVVGRDPNDPASRAALADPSAGFCRHDVEAGDKLYLTGCLDDTGCGPRETCYFDPASPDPTHGMCLPRGPSLTTAQSVCAPWLHAFRRYRVTRSFDQRLELEELAEPEHPSDTHACAGDADCADVLVTGAQSGQVVTLPTACLPDAGGGRTCLRRCKLRPAGSTSAPSVEEVCGAGYACAASHLDSPADRAANLGRCLRAPLPEATSQSLCFAELAQYEIHAGDAFAVGSDISAQMLPSPLDVDPATMACVPAAGVSPLAEPRARLDAPPCDASLANDWLALQPPGAPNSCRIVPPGDDGRHRYIHFENPVLSTVLVVPTASVFAGGAVDGGVAAPDAGTGGGIPAVTHVPADDTIVSFVVLGGYRALGIALGVDVAAQMPRSSQVAPDGHTVYVVDEGKQTTATGLRGQILRFLSATQVTDKDFTVR